MDRHKAKTREVARLASEVLIHKVSVHDSAIRKLRFDFQEVLRKHPEVGEVFRTEHLRALPFLRSYRDEIAMLIQLIEASPS